MGTYSVPMANIRLKDKNLSFHSSIISEVFGLCTIEIVYCVSKLYDNYFLSYFPVLDKH